MSPRPLDTLPDNIVQALLEKLAPGSRATLVELMPGSFSNHTHLVEAGLPDGTQLKCAVRRYQAYGDYDRGEKASREYQAFQLMHRAGIPGPEPLLLDESGEVLGVPGIVTRIVEGELRMDNPSEPLPWARAQAQMLARIHAIPLEEAARSFLLEADREASWFIRSDEAPEWMRAYPGGAELWRAVKELYPRRQAVEPALVHVDFWPGNILWDKDEITAVFDWEEAAWGDPAVDVGYARLNMHLLGLREAAQEFLRVYEAERGRAVANLGLWELAAAARPMQDPAAWELGKPGQAELLAGFIEEASGH